MRDDDRTRAFVRLLSAVIEPASGRDLVTAGLIHDLTVEGQQVVVTMAPVPEARRAGIEGEVRAALAEGPDVAVVEVRWSGSGSSPSAPSGASPTRRLPMAGAPAKAAPTGPGAGPGHHQGIAGRREIPGVTHLVAVASGKGGVGKSTVCVNLALALSRLGKRVGLLDADIYGPSIPLMLNVNRRPEPGPTGSIAPLTSYGLKLMSLGFLLDESQPVIWRGPMVQGVVRQFLHEVEWGDLDFLMIDLPPGTGDAQLTLVQSVALSGAIIVTTPSDLALIDAAKGLNMFRTVNVPVLGVVENMSYFSCPHCHERSDIFSSHGGRRIADKLGAPFLGEIPLVGDIRQGGDEGRPIVALAPESASAAPFFDLARSVLTTLEGASAEKKGFFASLFERSR